MKIHGHPLATISVLFVRQQRHGVGGKRGHQPRVCPGCGLRIHGLAVDTENRRRSGPSRSSRRAHREVMTRQVVASRMITPAVGSPSAAPNMTSSDTQ